MKIRPAQLGDAEAVASLLHELDRPATPAEARERLSRLRGRPDGDVLVAEVEGEPVAVAGYHLLEQLHRADVQCRVTTLVVGAAHRRRGAARALLAAIESIAREAGCRRVEVTTLPESREALSFYAAAGFEERPVRLVKWLA